MRAVVQRVIRSSVVVDNKEVGNIGKGLTVLLGVENDDTEKDMQYMADKIVNLRIFEDSSGKMNLSALDVGGELLVVSQFTLFGDCRKGKRPSFTKAASSDFADSLYKEFVKYIKDRYPIKVETGVFQAQMQLEIHNDGPVTILLDSKKLF
ncbi:MAG: D-tyrosyl-tRNA(Tyr) deacylase [Clostridiaceae bacterium]|nr:D-tyrosyl-tRNA(Tyr) deacylase [Clostridiaceae bacterium]